MSPIRGTLLQELAWLDHGFGTRHDGAWTPDACTARLRQVHADGVVTVEGPGHFGEGDALITATAGVWLEIRTADCVPLLFADSQRRIVAAVHAGWRGTAAKIAALTVEKLRDAWGSRPEDLRVSIGPSIGACCFEVGPEVAEQFPGHITQREPRPHVDLVEANRSQLLAAGLAAAQIETLGLCTVCDAARFHSFRRDRGDGRMVSSISIRRPE